MMTPKLFCPNCGHPVAEGDRFCENCGAKLGDFVPTDKARVVHEPYSATGSVPTSAEPPPATSTPTSPPPMLGPSTPSYYVPPAQPGVVQQGYRTLTKDQYMTYKASLLKRVGAYLLDGLIFGAMGVFCPIIPWFKDVIPEQGKSFGKMIVGIKVIDYETGKPIDTGQACVRQIGFMITCGLDAVIPFFTHDGRRIGDYMANSIVVEDM